MIHNPIHNFQVWHYCTFLIIFPFLFLTSWLPFSLNSVSLKSINSHWLSQHLFLTVNHFCIPLRSLFYQCSHPFIIIAVILCTTLLRYNYFKGSEYDAALFSGLWTRTETLTHLSTCLVNHSLFCTKQHCLDNTINRWWLTWRELISCSDWLKKWITGIICCCNDWFTLRVKIFFLLAPVYLEIILVN